jgi:hypothetical protein
MAKITHHDIKYRRVRRIAPGMREFLALIFLLVFIRRVYGFSQQGINYVFVGSLESFVLKTF